VGAVSLQTYDMWGVGL